MSDLNTELDDNEIEQAILRKILESDSRQDAPSVEDVVETRINWETASERLASLTDDQRSVILEHFLEDKSLKTWADEHNVSPATAGRIQSEGLKVLRDGFPRSSGIETG